MERIQFNFDMNGKENPNYWQWRANTGAKKKISSPKVLLELAMGYFEWIDAHPFEKQDFIKSGPAAGQIVITHYPRPYTWQGLQLWIKNKTGLVKLEDYRINRQNKYAKFSDAIAQITEIIDDNKLSGALSGHFNPNIVSKQLGLVEKTESTVKTEQPLFPDVE